MSNNLPNISLWFCEGTSDKVYKAAVEDAGKGLYSVNFAYGRRNSTLNTGTKTQSPVDLENATKIYNKLVLSKTAKGYKPTDDSGSIASSITTAVKDIDQRDTGLRPQLLNPITEDEAEKYILNNDWCSQEKFNGKRMTVKKDNKETVAANKKGLSIGFPDAIANEAKAVNVSFTTDGESIGDVLHAFDILEHGGSDLRGTPYLKRLIALNGLTKDLKSIIVAETAMGTKQKSAMMAKLKAAGKEGIVFKCLSAKWYAGRPASGGSAIKCKFWESCSCVVSKVNAKRSVAISLEGQPIGKVTIPPNFEVPTIGQVIEVKYLYVVGKGGSLYQPIYLGVRDDVDASECTFKLQKIKYKPEDD